METLTMTQEIYIGSRVCEELDISYNNPGEYNPVSVEDFVTAWQKMEKDPYYISVRDSYEDANMRRMLFEDFIKFKEVLNLKNISSGHFEI